LPVVLPPAPQVCDFIHPASHTQGDGYLSLGGRGGYQKCRGVHPLERRKPREPERGERRRLSVELPLPSVDVVPDDAVALRSPSHDDGFARTWITVVSAHLGQSENRVNALVATTTNVDSGMRSPQAAHAIPGDLPGDCAWPLL